MRPTERPATPYSKKEIAERVWQHFFRERNPYSYNCVTDVCLYSGSGCAVGCLLTQEDADKLDSDNVSTPISECFKDLSNYFTADMLYFLEALQVWHDQYHANWNYLLSIFHNHKILTGGFEKELANEAANKTK